MSIEKKNKDNLKQHGGVRLLPPEPPKSDDPLKFWTSHPTEQCLVDLHSFADGEFENPSPYGSTAGNWGGPFTGRPNLIAELAPAIQARCAFVGRGAIGEYFYSLRMWWRLFDSIEAAPAAEGHINQKVSSVAHLNALHEAVATQRGMNTQVFTFFRSVANNARALLRLPELGWFTPSDRTSESHLIPDDQARHLKTAIKQDWERVLKTWARNDRIRSEGERRAAGEPAVELGDDECLLKNWQHFRKIQQKTGLTLPPGTELLDEKSDATYLYKQGLERRVMRSILFPTVEEADIAFHLALMNSGWNPSTLMKVDSTNPYLVLDHPKDASKLVLADDEADGHETLIADKARARGRRQFCVGNKSQPSSAPMIVAAYLNRVVVLRELLRADCEIAQQELAHLRNIGAEQDLIAAQLNRVQKLQKGSLCVWLYVDINGNIAWLNENNWKRYRKPDGGKGMASYLDLVRYRLNARRGAEDQIPNVTPSDFRDIYARWVYIQSNGNILAVMLALGHQSSETTVRYVSSKIYKVEHDEQIRRFMVHLFDGLGRGEIDLTKLAQLVRHGEITPEMEARLAEYRALMRSRIGVACADPRHPPEHVAPGHIAGRLCGTQRCLNQCEHARFLPEALNGIAMRVEELMVLSDHLPREPWLREGFQEELEMGEELLERLFASDAAAEARASWRERILAGAHLIPGLGRIGRLEEVA